MASYCLFVCFLFLSFFLCVFLSLFFFSLFVSPFCLFGPLLLLRFRLSICLSASIFLFAFAPPSSSFLHPSPPLSHSPLLPTLFHSLSYSLSFFLVLFLPIVPDTIKHQGASEQVRNIWGSWPAALSGQSRGL